MTGPLDVLVIGGGIAGCSAGIALADAGHRVEIVERADAWRFQSSGIFIYANGLTYLDDLGVLPGVLAAGFAVPDGRNSYYDHTGAAVVETFYPAADGGRIPAILGIKRAELHRVLAARLDALGVPVRLGTTVAAIDDRAVTFADGRRDTYDLILGADGIRSATRAMIGVAAHPRYTGFGVWRAVHPRPESLAEKIMIMGPAKRFGIMPISDDRLYTFATMVEPKGRRIPPETWPEAMRARFAEFGGPAAPFLAGLGPESEVLFTAVEEIVLPAPWHRGRVLLVGDAAHASTPFMGQGGAMALQDAVVLARVLARERTLDAALGRFAAARAPVCRFVQDVSRAVGQAGADETAESRAERNAALAATAQAKVDDFYARLAVLDAEADALIAG